jgi:hypothetical protein
MSTTNTTTQEIMDFLKNNMATKTDLQEIRAEMATKNDLKAYATKEDLKAFATKEDLKAFATKANLDTAIENLATKSDVRWLERRTREDTNAIVEEIIDLKERMVKFEGRRDFGYRKLAV